MFHCLGILHISSSHISGIFQVYFRHISGNISGKSRDVYFNAGIEVGGEKWLREKIDKLEVYIPGSLSQIYAKFVANL